MEFRETLLAAQRNQQQKSSENSYYKAKFDPPKKEQKHRDKLSANIQKFLAKKDEEERQKKIEAERKRDELLAMRDPKLMRKIQKSLKVFKSANKSVIQDAIDHDNTAVTREGPEQPGQDDYGYESQEAAAIYEKMMQKYSKIPDEPKFPVGNSRVKKDLNGTRERVKHALQHEDDPVPHKRRRKTTDSADNDRESSPPSKYEPEKKKDEKPEKPKFRKPAPPPMDFNQLLKLAEQKKSEPVTLGSVKKTISEPEPDKLMTKKQKQEYEEQIARHQRRQERLDAEKGGGKKIQREDRQNRKEPERERKVEPSGFGRIPKLGNKSASIRTDSPKSHDKERERYERDRQDRDRAEKMQREKERDRQDRDRSEKMQRERERDRQDRDRAEKMQREKERDRQDRDRAEKMQRERERDRQDRNRVEKMQREKERDRQDRDRAEKMQREKERVMLEREKSEREKLEREKLRVDRERLDKLKAERDRIDREMERLNKDRDRLDKTKSKLEAKTTDRIKPVEKAEHRSKLTSREPMRQEPKKNIDLKSQNTYRIDMNSNERKVFSAKNDSKHMNGHSSHSAKNDSKHMNGHSSHSAKNDIKYTNGHSSQGKPVPKSNLPSKDGSKGVMHAKQKPYEGSPKLNGHARPQIGKQMPDTKGMTSKRPDDRKPGMQAGSSKPTSNSFDFDKHVNSLGKNGGRQFPPGHVKRKPNVDDIKKKPKRRLESDSEYDSEMDDFIDDEDENLDYSSEIKKIFGYDKSRYRDIDDEDDPNMESSFAQQQREEYISKKQGILEDLEDMRLEALEKKKAAKKKRRISDD